MLKLTIGKDNKTNENCLPVLISATSDFCSIYVGCVLQHTNQTPWRPCTCTSWAPAQLGSENANHLVFGCWKDWLNLDWWKIWRWQLITQCWEVKARGLEGHTHGITLLGCPLSCLGVWHSLVPRLCVKLMQRTWARSSWDVCCKTRLRQQIKMFAMLSSLCTMEWEVEISHAHTIDYNHKCKGAEPPSFCTSPNSPLITSCLTLCKLQLQVYSSDECH